MDETLHPDTVRLNWLIKHNMLMSWTVKYREGNFTSLRAIGTANVLGIETDDPRKAIDRAIAKPKQVRGL